MGTADENRDGEQPLLEIRDLHVRFDTSEGQLYAVNGIDLTIQENETLGIVGESGSGKSVSALTILQLLSTNAHVSGEIRFRGEDLIDKTDEQMRSIRGDQIAMIFQDPGSSLNPVLKVGDQVSETIRTHQQIKGEGISRYEGSILGNIVRSRDAFSNYEESWNRTVELFERVGIPLPEQRALEYPHEFSGGMKQRALIAMAISCQPELLIADEPTTALDVTIEAQILELIEELQAEFGTSVLFITHDMGVINEVSDRVAVMYAGNLVEKAPTDQLFEHPKHPYSKALLNSIPKITGSRSIESLSGQVPNLQAEPTMCSFAPRCPNSNAACYEQFPPEYPVGNDDKPAAVTDTAELTTYPSPRTVEGENHTVSCVLFGDAEELPAEPDQRGGDEDRTETAVKGATDE